MEAYGKILLIAMPAFLAFVLFVLQNHIIPRLIPLIWFFVVAINKLDTQAIVEKGLIKHILTIMIMKRAISKGVVRGTNVL